MKKKVLLCIPTLGIGGAEKFVVDLATRIDRDAFDVTVAVTRQFFASNFETVLAEHGVRIVDLSDNRFGKMLRKQVAFLKKERPDVVHTNIGSMLHIMIATSLVNVPVKLFTMHNEAGYILTGKAKRLLYKLAFTLFGYTPVAICPMISRSIHEAFRLPYKRIKTVNNGVDLSRFTHTDIRTPSDTVQIITTGTMYFAKNHRLLLNVFAEVHRAHPQTRLTILGDGELREQLEQQAVDLGIADAVNMPGIQKDVCSHLQKADVYVSASNTEGLPLSILEALACGLPVVATAAGGTVDIVKTGENGIVVPVKDEAALIQALGLLADDAALRQSYGDASLRIVQDWSLEACVRGYEALYLKR